MKTKQLSKGATHRYASVAVTLLLLAACASAPKAPTHALQAAELAIASAEQARVAEYASLELSEARSKLTAARSEVKKENMVLAERLANESRVNAELAFARTEAAKATEVNDEMKASTKDIKQEMQRNTGGQ
jgi:flagellar biosynthesis component FlhA